MNQIFKAQVSYYVETKRTREDWYIEAPTLEKAHNQVFEHGKDLEGLTVGKIERSTIHEINRANCPTDEPDWFEVRVKLQEEKVVKNNHLVMAENAHMAYDHIEERVCSDDHSLITGIRRVKVGRVVLKEEAL